MIAVIGASSYEGRQMLLSLADEGCAHVGFDDHADIASHHAVMVTPLALDDSAAVAAAFKDHGVTDVIHLPKRGTVANSLRDPLDAFEAVLRPLMSVLRAAAEVSIDTFVLSSTASVYGTPERVPVDEDTVLAPISPLGAAARGAEQITQDVCARYGIPTVILRYFNAAGADPMGRSGESDAPKHLITAAIRIASGRREGPLKIYGNDYDTPDGTAIRDYVHVADVASAHIHAVTYLRAGGQSVILNCGYGDGASVQDVVQSIERVTGKPLPSVVEGRRAGDPPQLIADTAAIRSVLGWRPQFNDLDLIIRTAIDWESRHGAAFLEDA
ncbi:MAG: UDP-glucose 4-epimerase GalE [Pseudomonadota bacterium]